MKPPEDDRRSSRRNVQGSSVQKPVILADGSYGTQSFADSVLSAEKSRSVRSPL